MGLYKRREKQGRGTQLRSKETVSVSGGVGGNTLTKREEERAEQVDSPCQVPHLWYGASARSERGGASLHRWGSDQVRGSKWKEWRERGRCVSCAQYSGSLPPSDLHSNTSSSEKPSLTTRFTYQTSFPSRPHLPHPVLCFFTAPLSACRVARLLSVSPSRKWAVRRQASFLFSSAPHPASSVLCLVGGGQSHVLNEWPDA